MMVSVSADVMNSPARVGLVKDILEITEHFSKKHNLQMNYSGLPYIRVVNAENIKGEMYMFIILSLLITTFILYLFFRSFRIIGFCLLIVQVFDLFAIRLRHETESARNHDQTHKVHECDTNGGGYSKFHEDLT